MVRLEVPRPFGGLLGCATVPLWLGAPADGAAECEAPGGVPPWAGEAALPPRRDRVAPPAGVRIAMVPLELAVLGVLPAVPVPGVEAAGPEPWREEDGE